MWRTSEGPLKVIRVGPVIYAPYQMDDVVFIAQLSYLLSLFVKLFTIKNKKIKKYFLFLQRGSLSSVAPADPRR